MRRVQLPVLPRRIRRRRIKEKEEKEERRSSSSFGVIKVTDTPMVSWLRLSF
jgi:hypothetical protein